MRCLRGSSEQQEFYLLSQGLVDLNKKLWPLWISGESFQGMSTPTTLQLCDFMKLSNISVIPKYLSELLITKESIQTIELQNSSFWPAFSLRVVLVVWLPDQCPCLSSPASHVVPTASDWVTASLDSFCILLLTTTFPHTPHFTVADFIHGILLLSYH